MQLGLKNRLRLISLLPIVILISITSYFVLNSYHNYVTAQLLQDKLLENRELNKLVNNISRERGMTVMYLGNSSPNTLRSLVKQRDVVDEVFENYLKHVEKEEVLHDHSKGMENCHTCNNVKSIQTYMKNIVRNRNLVDAHQTNFQDVMKTSMEELSILLFHNLKR